jgi:hypothetical protein
MVERMIIFLKDAFIIGIFKEFYLVNVVAFK